MSCVSKSCKVNLDSRARNDFKKLMIGESVIRVHIRFHLNPFREYRLSILPGHLNMINRRRSVPMLHAEGIHVAQNCTDKPVTTISGKLIHECILYFEKMPPDVGLFSLILHCPNGDSYVRPHLKRDKSDSYYIDIFHD